MNFRFLYPAGPLLGLALATFAQIPTDAANASEGTPVLGAWGAAVDPDHLGKYAVEGEALSITVGDGQHPADLHVDSKSNAPLALNEVNGDFTLEITIQPVAPSEAPSLVRYGASERVAGLVAFLDDKNYVRFDELARHDGNGNSQTIEFNLVEEGVKKVLFDSRALDWNPDKPLRFRIERRGPRLHAAINQGQWQEIYPLNFWRWPAHLRIGLVATNTTSESFTAHFSDLTLDRKPGSAAAPARFISPASPGIPFPDLNPADTLAGKWGIRVNPEAIGNFQATEETLNIEMPGVPADYSSATHLYNSPHALQEIEGDFAVSLLVQPVSKAVGDVYQQQTPIVNSAGLMAMADGSTFFRFETLRSIERVYNRPDHRQLIYEYQNGERRDPQEPELPWMPDKPTWLKLERRGGMLRGMHSEDGKDWIYHPLIDVSSWPAKIRIGINVSQTASLPFTAEFSNYSISKTLPPRNAEIPLAPLAVAPEDEIPGWGTKVDPDHAASFTLQGNDLTASLSAANSQFNKDVANAPRIVTKADGDFTAQVRVDPPTPRDEGADLRCAGLVIMANNRTYIRLDRGVQKEKGKRGRDILKMRFLLQGMYAYELDSDEVEWNDSAPTWLRLKRQGNTVEAAISEDGQKWTPLKSQDISDLPPQLYVGVFAANSTGKAVTLRMHDYKLEKGD